MALPALSGKAIEPTLFKQYPQAHYLGDNT